MTGFSYWFKYSSMSQSNRFIMAPLFEFSLVLLGSFLCFLLVSNLYSTIYNECFSNLRISSRISLSVLLINQSVCSVPKIDNYNRNQILNRLWEKTFDTMSPRNTPKYYPSICLSRNLVPKKLMTPTSVAISFPN